MASWLRTRAAVRFPDPLRLLPLPVVAGYLAVVAAGPVGAAGWAIGLGAAVLTVAGERFPLTVGLGQAALMALAVRVEQGAAAVVLPLAMLALGELWMRRDDAARWVGAAGLAAAVWPGLDPVRAVGTALLITVPPALVGAYVRSVLRIASRTERRRARDVARARAAERTAIARELHDLVAHHLSSIAVRTGAARYAVAHDGAAAGVLADVHDSARDALGDLRKLLTTLREPVPASCTGPGVLPADTAGLRLALDAAVDDARAAGVAVESRIEGLEHLDAARRFAVLRVVQESLVNVRTHVGAGATARLLVRAGGDPVLVSVDDDGAGRRRDHHRRGGLGILGMRERVELLDGTLEARPADGGWSVHATFPGRPA